MTYRVVVVTVLAEWYFRYQFERWFCWGRAVVARRNWPYRLQVRRALPRTSEFARSTAIPAEWATESKLTYLGYGEALMLVRSRSP